MDVILDVDKYSILHREFYSVFALTNDRGFFFVLNVKNCNK